MRRIGVVLLGSSLLLAGCGGGDEAAAPEASTTAAATTAAGVDRTAELQAAGAGQSWDGVVTSAQETEPGRMVVSTTIVDPRGDDGSPEAQQALGVCQAALALLGSTVTNIRVDEADGTGFVLYGPPVGAACEEY